MKSPRKKNSRKSATEPPATLPPTPLQMEGERIHEKIKKLCIEIREENFALTGIQPLLGPILLSVLNCLAGQIKKGVVKGDEDCIFLSIFMAEAFAGLAKLAHEQHPATLRHFAKSRPALAVLVSPLAFKPKSKSGEFRKIAQFLAATGVGTESDPPTAGNDTSADLNGMRIARKAVVKVKEARAVLRKGTGLVVFEGEHSSSVARISSKLNDAAYLKPLSFETRGEWWKLVKTAILEEWAKSARRKAADILWAANILGKPESESEHTWALRKIRESFYHIVGGRRAPSADGAQK